MKTAHYLNNTMKSALIHRKKINTMTAVVSVMAGKLQAYKIIIIFFISIHLIFRLLSPLHAQQVYSASTLHNAASRSQTIQRIFYQRWDTMQNNFCYFDAYVDVNWVFDFDVNTYNRGTGATEAVPMKLVRTFSSMLLVLPVYTPHDVASNEYGQLPQADITNATEASPSKKSWEKNSVLLGLSVCGYHYGLTRTVEISRGSAGSETASDYAFSQFFDDIAALTLLIVPYITIHCGIIFNQQIEPNDDGTLDYNFDPSKTTKRLLTSLTLFNAITWESTAANDQIEATDISVNITQFISIVKTTPQYMPAIIIGYKQFKKYNDEDYDPVWVKNEKLPGDSSRDSATLYSYYATVRKNIDNFYMAASIQLQHVDQTIIDKRTLKTIDVPVLQMWSMKAGYDFFHQPGWDFFVWLGLTHCYDPAISFHSNHDNNNVTGWFAMMDIASPLFTFTLKGSYNDSYELEKLVESVDKYIIEGSASFRL